MATEQPNTPPASTTPATAAAPAAGAAGADGKPAAPAATTPPAASTTPVTTPPALGADGKPVTTPPPAEVVYDLKAPEGVQVEKAHLDEIAAYAKENGLTPAVAQKQLERELGLRTSITAKVTEQATAALRNTSEKVWPDQVKADKELGGAAFAENMATAKRAIDRFGSPALKQALNETGLGNHPELVRFCVAIGKQIADDNIIPAGNTAGGETRLADRLFGQPKSKE